MRKKLPLLLLVLSLALPAVSLGAEGTTFVDVSPGDWFAPYVEVCAKEGLLNGVGEGKFNPQGVLNGDEALVMAARVLLAANGEAEFPKGPDAQGFWDEFGWEEGLKYSFGTSVEDTQSYANAWYWDALYYLAKAAGPELFPQESVVYSTDRQTFFRALAFACKGLDLPTLNSVEQVPGTRDPEILRLYQAGIVSGTDLYGSFDGQLPLTRAEAAAALARIAEPGLRLRFTPQSQSYPYTLTCLMDDYGGNAGWFTYPVLALPGGTAYGGASGLLSLDGVLHPWPGNTPSFGLERSGEYAWFSCWNEDTPDDPWDQLRGLMDRTGQMAVPLGAYGQVRATQDGRLLATGSGESEDAPWYLLNRDLTVAAELPPVSALPENGSTNSGPASWYGLNQGLLAYQDGESGLWGYVDQSGRWLVKPVWASAGNYCRGYAAAQNQEGLWGCIDLKGNIVLPFQYSLLEPARDSWDYEGPMIFAFQDENGQTGLLTLNGPTCYIPLDSEDFHIRAFQNGYGLCFSGYDHPYSWYINALGETVSEKFDWAGPITADGQGFVGMDQKIYRIQFEK